MASIRARTSKLGVTTYAVLFRDGRRQSSVTFETESAADRFRTLVELLGPSRALAELDGQPVNTVTVDELAERFFEWKAGDVEPRTLKDYRRDYVNWLQPFLGNRRADTVTETDVQQLVDHMATRLDPKSVADRHMILSSMFKWGSSPTRRIVEGNPCTSTSLPRRKRKPVKGVTIAEWQQIHAAAARVAPDAADLLLFIVSTGWRWSEAAALTVRHIEDVVVDDRVVMFVSMGAVLRRDVDDRQVLVEDTAKSFAGLRRVKVPGSTAHMLRGRLVGKGPADYVFTTSTGRPWRQSNFLYRTWPKVLDAAQLTRRPTPHWLRHTHVALADRAGVSLAEIQRRLGHEDISTTINVYGGMIDDMTLDSLDRLDDILTAPTVGVVLERDVLRELG